VDLAQVRADDVLLDLLSAGFPAPDGHPVTVLLAAWRDACRPSPEEDAQWLPA
jgi:hypothetical protein